MRGVAPHREISDPLRRGGSILTRHGRKRAVRLALGDSENITAPAAPPLATGG